MMDRYLEYVQFQGQSVISRMISRYTRDEDTHSAVLDREAPGTKQLIEQWPHLGSFDSWMDYSDFKAHKEGTPYVVWSLRVTQLQYDSIMNYYRASAKMKKSYDWKGILAFLSKSSDSDEATFCSEEMIMPLCVVLGWDSIRPVVVYPGMFRMLLQAAGAVVTQKGVCGS